MHWGAWTEPPAPADQTQTLQTQAEMSTKFIDETVEQRNRVFLPFIVLGVEVFFLHGGLSLGGFAFIWQKHERDVAVDSILTLCQKASVCGNGKYLENEEKWRKSKNLKIFFLVGTFQLFSLTPFLRLGCFRVMWFHFSFLFQAIKLYKKKRQITAGSSS